MKKLAWVLACIIGIPIGMGVAGLYTLLIMGNCPLWMWLVSIVGAGVLATGITKISDRRREQSECLDENLTVDVSTLDYEPESKKELKKSINPKKAVQTQDPKKTEPERLTYDQEMEDQIFSECFATYVTELHQSEEMNANPKLQESDFDQIDFDEIYLEALQSYLSGTKEENGYQKSR